MRIIHPEFEDDTLWPDSVVEVFVSEAADQLEYSVWKNDYERGVLALAAHMMKLADFSRKKKSGGGRLSQIKTSQLSEAYAPTVGVTSDDAIYMKTQYGEEFLRLKRRQGGGPITVP